MSGKKQRRQNSDDQIQLKDTLGAELLQKLQDTKKELKNEEEQKKQEAAKKKAEERRLREKNKSFEELLAESEMDWKKYK